MKQRVTAYTFDKVAKTVTFTGFTTINLDQILLITDVTNNTVIFAFNNPALGGTVATNVLTLTLNTNTGSFANTDKLQIFYDVTAAFILASTPTGPRSACFSASDAAIATTSTSGAVFVRHADIYNSTAAGASIPFIDRPGFDAGGNTNWVFLPAASSTNMMMGV